MPIPTDPLPIPITRTATQFKLSEIRLDMDNLLVSAIATQFDATGLALESRSFNDTFAAFNLVTPDTASLRTKVLAFIKAKGFIN